MIVFMKWERIRSAGAFLRSWTTQYEPNRAKLCLPLLAKCDAHVDEWIQREVLLSVVTETYAVNINNKGTKITQIKWILHFTFYIYAQKKW